MKVVVICIVFVLSACVFYPTKLDERPDCKTISREFEIKENTAIGNTVLGIVENCNDEACVTILLGALGVSASSYMVSSGFVITGNTLNWVERSAKCSKEKQEFNWGKLKN